jgi:hypothetical protein
MDICDSPIPQVCLNQLFDRHRFYIKQHPEQLKVISGRDVRLFERGIELPSDLVDIATDVGQLARDLPHGVDFVLTQNRAPVDVRVQQIG